MPVAPVGFTLVPGAEMSTGQASRVFGVAREGEAPVQATRTRAARRSRGSGERLLAEGRLLALLGGRATPRLVASGEDASGPWLVMQRLDWPPLASYAGGRDAGWLEGATRAAFEALATVHAAGVVHGDVSPDNVLVSGDGTHAALVDFGLALAPTMPPLPAGPFRGTLLYAAPEVARGEPYDGAADRFAMAASVLHVWSGEAPRTQGTDVAMLLAAGEQGIEAWAERAALGLAPEVARTLRTCCSFDAKDRAGLTWACSAPAHAPSFPALAAPDCPGGRPRSGERHARVRRHPADRAGAPRRAPVPANVLGVPRCHRARVRGGPGPFADPRRLPRGGRGRLPPGGDPGGPERDDDVGLVVVAERSAVGRRRLGAGGLPPDVERPAGARARQPSAGRSDATRGADLFAGECAACHGQRGVDGTFVGIGSVDLLRAASDGFLRQAIRDGRPGTPMPSFARRLGEAGVDDVLAALRSWQKNAPPGRKPPAKLPPLPLGPVPIHPHGPEPVGFTVTPQSTKIEIVKAQLDAGARMGLLDARAPSDYIGEHIADAVSVPFYDPEPYFAQLPKDAWLVCYCSCPSAESGQLAQKLLQNGFTKVTVLEEGLRVWKAKKYPTNQGFEP